MFEWNVRETMDTIRPDYSLVVSEMESVFQEADFRMLNLETPVIAEDYNLDVSIHPDKPYVFRAFPADISILKSLSVNLVSLGNNHAMDFGQKGLRQTRTFLKNEGLLSIGAGDNFTSAYQPYKFSANKQNFTIYSSSLIGQQDTFASKEKGGIAKFETGYLVRDLANIRKNAGNDISQKILSLHWGIEYSPAPESYQRRVAHRLIDFGFSAVIGHHPHIPQGVEKYKNGIIFYSLGNFIFGSKNQLLNHNLVAILHFSENKLKIAEIIPVFGKFQELNSFYIYPLAGEEANSFLQEICIQSRKLGTEIFIKNNRGYIYF